MFCKITNCFCTNVFDDFLKAREISTGGILIYRLDGLLTPGEIPAAGVVAVAPASYEMRLWVYAKTSHLRFVRPLRRPFLPVAHAFPLFLRIPLILHRRFLLIGCSPFGRLTLEFIEMADDNRKRKRVESGSRVCIVTG